MRFNQATLAEWGPPTEFPPPYGRHSSWWASFEVPTWTAEEWRQLC